jgi:hypothetical protein
MPWVKLDDGFGEHPKVLAAGPLAGWLYVCGLCYANRQRTDGFLTEAVIYRLADVDRPQDLAEELVSAGLWHRVSGGYRIHDYLDYQPSREQAEQISQVRADAGRKGGLATAEAKSKHVAVNVLQANASKSQARPLPVPDPEPDSGIKTQPAVGAAAPPPPRPDLRKPKDREKGWIEDHPLFQATVDLFGKPVGEHWALRAKCLREFDELGATSDDLRARHGRYPVVMGKDRDGTPMALTLPALIKHWHLCAPPAVNGRARAPAEPPPRSKAETAELRRRILAGEEIE